MIGSKVASSTGSSVMVLDATTLKNLDVFVCSSGSSRGSTLWSLLNFTSNPMGTRMLRRWITQPLCDLQKIVQRQKAIADILEGRLDEATVLQLQKQLKSMGDVERVLCRIHAKMEVKVERKKVEFCFFPPSFFTGSSICFLRECVQESRKNSFWIEECGWISEQSTADSAVGAW